MPRLSPPLGRARLQRALARQPIAPADCLYRNVSSSARLLAAAFDRAFAASGLTANQFNLLMTLAHAEPLPVGQLAARLATDASTLPRLLAALTQGGLVDIRRGSDRRVRLVSVTDAGCDRLRRALPAWAQLQQQLLQSLGTERWARTRESLARVRRILRAAA